MSSTIADYEAELTIHVSVIDSWDVQLQLFFVMCLVASSFDVVCDDNEVLLQKSK